MSMDIEQKIDIINRLLNDPFIMESLPILQDEILEGLACGKTLTQIAREQGHQPKDLLKMLGKCSRDTITIRSGGEVPTAKGIAFMDYAFVLCPYCLRVHNHGVRNGHRAAHCSNNDIKFSRSSGKDTKRGYNVTAKKVVGYKDVLRFFDACFILYKESLPTWGGIADYRRIMKQRKVDFLTRIFHTFHRQLSLSERLEIKELLEELEPIGSNY